MKVAADRRAQALGVADDDNLEARFSDIQLFVGMFPDDEHVRKASTELTISILSAVEQTIAFFTANECKLNSILLEPRSSSCSWSGWKGHLHWRWLWTEISAEHSTD